MFRTHQDDRPSLDNLDKVKIFKSRPISFAFTPVGVLAGITAVTAPVLSAMSPVLSALPFAAPVAGLIAAASHFAMGKVHKHAKQDEVQKFDTSNQALALAIMASNEKQLQYFSRGLDDKMVANLIDLPDDGGHLQPFPRYQLRHAQAQFYANRYLSSLDEAERHTHKVPTILTRDTVNHISPTTEALKNITAIRDEYQSLCKDLPKDQNDDYSAISPKGHLKTLDTNRAVSSTLLGLGCAQLGLACLAKDPHLIAETATDLIAMGTSTLAAASLLQNVIIMGRLPEFSPGQLRYNDAKLQKARRKLSQQPTL